MANNLDLENLAIDVDGARAELMSKDYTDIQRETSLKWMARALAAYEIGTNSETAKETVLWLEMGNEYIHEALEHAALVEDGGQLVAALSDAGAEAKHALTSSIFGNEEEAEGQSEDDPEELFEEPGEEEESSEDQNKALIEDVAGKINEDQS